MTISMEKQYTTPIDVEEGHGLEGAAPTITEKEKGNG